MGVPKMKRQGRAFEGYVSLKGPFFVQLFYSLKGGELKGYRMVPAGLLHVRRNR